MRADRGLLRRDRQEQPRARLENDQDAGRRVRRGRDLGSHDRSIVLIIGEVPLPAGAPGDDVPAVVDWKKETKELEAFLARMPFKVPLHARVSDISAGERQKCEILKQLYLKRRFLILDEPTSVLTPGEADEVLGMLRAMV